MAAPALAAPGPPQASIAAVSTVGFAVISFWSAAMRSSFGLVKTKGVPKNLRASDAICGFVSFLMTPPLLFNFATATGASSSRLEDTLIFFAAVAAFSARAISEIEAASSPTARSFRIRSGSFWMPQ